MKPRLLSRRQFAKAVAVAGLSTTGVAHAASSTAPAPSTAASNRVRLGFIGVGNRGDQVLSAFLKHPDAEVVAIADLNQPISISRPRRSGRRGRTASTNTGNCSIARTSTPWSSPRRTTGTRCRPSTPARRARTFTSRSRSRSRSPRGGRWCTAVSKYQRVAQVGLHRRSSKACHELVKQLQAGAIGKITAIRAFHIQNEWPHGIGHPDDTTPPEGFDWDKWQGPAAEHPYNPNRTFYRFRWFYDYSGGQVTNTGAHYLDLIHWVLDQRAPQSVAAMGGTFADFDNREVPDTLEAMWTYAPGTLVTFSQFNASDADASARPCEVEFRGTKGTLYFRGTSFEIVPGNVAARAYPVLSPTDRAGARGWRDGKPMIEPSQESFKEDPTIAHARQLSRLRQIPKALRLRHRNRPPQHHGHLAGKHRAADAIDAPMGRPARNHHEQ